MEGRFMIAESTARIIREICELNALGEGDWHIGAASDAERHLFKDLELPRNYRWCIHRCTASAKEAQAIILAFSNVGFQKCPRAGGGNDESAVHVFAYRKIPVMEKTTNEKTARV
jgi:hypothetical protein